MQQPTTNGLPGKRSADYVTIVAQACAKVTGFAQLYKDLERSISISGKSDSLLTNYGRQLAHLALHYDCVPTDLDSEQVMDYLHLVKSRGTVSATFFKFTVYSLRYACKLRGLTYEQFGLPGIDHDHKLPVVLNHDEMRRLIKSCELLKHRLLLSLLYGCGLRCSEVRNLSVRDVDLVRGMVHVRCGKGSKDRYLPLGVMLIRGIGLYLEAVRPQQWLFEGNMPGAGLSQRGTQWVVSMAVKKAGITKEVSTHTLRHTYATHLLEQGINILSIKDLLGHETIDTTMVYLHIAKPNNSNVFSPPDTLYRQL